MLYAPSSSEVDDIESDYGSGIDPIDNERNSDTEQSVPQYFSKMKDEGNYYTLADPANFVPPLPTNGL
jgi:hypothetical protein